MTIQESQKILLVNRNDDQSWLWYNKKGTKEGSWKIVEVSSNYPKGKIQGKLMSSQYGTEQEINSVKNLWKKTSKCKQGEHRIKKQQM